MHAVEICRHRQNPKSIYKSITNYARASREHFQVRQTAMRTKTPTCHQTVTARMQQQPKRNEIESM